MNQKEEIKMKEKDKKAIMEDDERTSVIFLKCLEQDSELQVWAQ